MVGAPLTNSGREHPFAIAVWALLVTACIGGLGLAFHHVPSTELAYRSSQVLVGEVAGGAMAHGLHHTLGTVAMIVLLSHLMLGLWRGSYAHDGRTGWWCSLGLLILITAFDATGQLLLWNEQGVLAAEVRAGIVRDAPVFGEGIRTTLSGASDELGIGAPALTRAHALHVAGLPLALLLLGMLLVPRFTGRPGRRVGLTAAIAGIGATSALLLAWLTRPEDTTAMLGLPFAPGDTLGFQPMPEWYLLWLNTVVSHGPSWSGTLLPGLLLAGLATLPILDAHGSHRTAVRITFGITGLLLAGLSLPPLLAEHEPRPAVLAPPEVQDPDLFHGYLSLRNQRCLDCHQVTVRGVTYGTRQHDAEPIRVWGADDEDFPDLLVDILESPGMTLGVLEMPPYDHMPIRERRQLAAFLRHLVEQPKDAD